MEKCSKCKKKISDDTIICNFCGEQQDISRSGRALKKNKKKTLIISLCFVGLLVILAGGFLYMQHQNEVAKKDVAALFDSDNLLKEDVTSDKLAMVNRTVSKVINPQVKKSLQEDLITATSMLNVNEGLKAVLNDENIINEKVTTKQLNDIKDSLDKVKSVSKKFYADNIKSYSSAQQQYNEYIKLVKEIEALYKNTNINEDTSRAIYEKLMSRNEKIKNDSLKKNLATKLTGIEKELLKSEEEARKNIINLSEVEIVNRVKAYYFSQTDITDDSVKVNYSVAYSGSPSNGDIMYLNPLTNTSSVEGSYTLTNRGDFKYTDATGNVLPEYNGNIFDDVSQEMIDAIPEFVPPSEETIDDTPEFTQSSFMGDWTSENLIISITESEVVMGKQQSGSAVFGHIVEQSFDGNTNTLSISAYEEANRLNGASKDREFNVQFVIKQNEGETYIEYQGKKFQQ